jgi:hypothetical protein
MAGGAFRRHSRLRTMVIPMDSHPEPAALSMSPSNGASGPFSSAGRVLPGGAAHAAGARSTGDPFSERAA